MKTQTGFIRQYIPKGTDFNGITHKSIEQIQYKSIEDPEDRYNTMPLYKDFLHL
ncbi:MAG: hypothetical protein VB098_01495 [Petrimonas sp.]|nr:hypothetical protein [Petrimonas sp.]